MSNQKPTVSVFDIDGTISDDRWRRKMINLNEPDTEKRYTAYHRCSNMDDLINKDLVEDRISKRDNIIFATARPEIYREPTEKWLRHHFPNLKFFLIMRGKTDKRHSPELKLSMMLDIEKNFFINRIYDDRLDVIVRLQDHWDAVLVPSHNYTEAEQTTPDAILRAMAATYQERDKVYGTNLQMVQPIVEILFPDGVPAFSTKMHILGLLLMKLTRFAVSDLTHIDSIHDLGAYAAIMESQVRKENQNA